MKAPPNPLGLGLGSLAAAGFVVCSVGCGDDPTMLGIVQGDASAAATGFDAGAGANPESGTPGTTDGALAETRADAPIPDSLSYILGADVTWTQQDVAGGATYIDADGTGKDILTLLKSHGFNYIRLRTFVDPTQPAPNPAGGTFAPYSTEGFGDLAHTITFGQRIKSVGLGFLLDFHYSDYWADPSKQIKPSAWASANLAALTTALHDYTKDAVSQLVAAGAAPDMVQIGNEITPGFELTPGTAMGPISNWTQLAQLLNAGIDAVHEVDPAIKIAIHLDRCADATTSAAFITNASKNGVAFDVFGESCYVAYQGPANGWQPTFASLAAAFPNLRFMAAEYNADPNDGTELRTMNDMVFGLPNHQGAGTFIWEPTRSGAWGPGLFTVNGNVYSAIAASLDNYDQMKVAYGL